MDGIKTIEKWKNWLKRIKVEAQNLVMYRSMFKDVIEIINANTELHEDNHFYRYMNDSHIALIVMGLRRQIKNDKQSISLVRLLTEISEAPHLMSRENYTELYSDSSIAFLADEHFDLFCENPNDQHVSKKMVLSDIQDFKESTELVESYADRFIAHSDKRGSKKLPTFEDIDNCLKILDKIYCKYNVLFYAQSMDSLNPTFQYHWKKIFEIAWITYEEK